MKHPVCLITDSHPSLCFLLVTQILLLHPVLLITFHSFVLFYSASSSSPTTHPSLSFIFPVLLLRVIYHSRSGASSLSGEPVVEGRAGRRSAAAAGQGAGGGHPGGAEQTPAVHVLHTQIRPGGAAAGEETTNCKHKYVCVFRRSLLLGQLAGREAQRSNI